MAEATRIFDSGGTRLHSMNILIMTRRFFPDCDAATSCVANLAKAMTSLGHQVSVLALSYTPGKTLPDHWQGIPVDWAYSTTAAERSEWKQMLDSHPMRGIQYLLGKALDRTLYRLKPSLRSHRIYPLRLRAYRKALGKALATRRFDALIATLYPLEAVIAMLGVRDRPPSYIYQLDAYWNNDDATPAQQQSCKKLLQQLFAKASGVFTMPSMFSLYQSEGMHGSSPMISCEFPMIREMEPDPCPAQWGHDDSIRLAFVGTLYPVFRSPETYVMLIAHLDLNVSACFVGGGQELLPACKAYEEAKSKIVCMGKQDLQTALSVEAGADVLVNIDNDHNPFQVPSKIFEYMSQGKPIVNLSTNPASGTIAYLARYPLSLTLMVNESSKEEMLGLLKTFLQKNHRQRMAFSRVKELFPEGTPESVAKRICGMMMDQSGPLAANGMANVR